jgi:hypothetical protein
VHDPVERRELDNDELAHHCLLGWFPVTKTSEAARWGRSRAGKKASKKNPRPCRIGERAVRGTGEGTDNAALIPEDQTRRRLA